jgi:hypothetical protein
MGTAMRRLIVPLLVSLLLAGVAQARIPIDDVFVGVGESRSGIDTYRLGLGKAFGGAFETSVGYLSGYGEAALIYWRDGDEVVYGGVLTPVLAYYFGGETAGVRPYLGGGIGVAYVSNTMMAGRDLSTRILLEDRIGVGVTSGRLDVYLSYVHYSNASLVLPNEGIDSLMLTVGWSFQE